tara:strand:+ start:1277 stop:1495 length:219 start_codon:yes stop_codon:yes gene_type:complete
MEDIIKSLRAIVHPSQNAIGDLPMAIQALDKVLTERGNELPGRLRHFLENRSYQKALIFLEGGEPEKGSCGN